MLLIHVDATSVSVLGNKIETEGPCVTRYRGNAWDRIASDLLCGAADPTENVRIAVLARPHMVTEAEIASADTEEWIKGPEHDGMLSYWHRLQDGSWLLVPKSRDAVETSMAWTMPYLKETENTIVSDTCSFVFQEADPKIDRVISALPPDNSTNADAVERTLRNVALFEFTWTYSFWKFTPVKMSLHHLVRVVDPVVGRINATLL